VSTDEMSAARWLRTNTDPMAVVQSLIEYHGGQFDYSLPICFGERKTALGLWQMAFQRYPNRDAITARVHEIQDLFSTSDDNQRAGIAHRLKINYVLIGPRERARFPDSDARFGADTVHFERQFFSPTVAIYWVKS
jgi:uncharacterized membrane protein